MRRPCTFLLRSLVVLAFLNISFSPAHASSSPQSRRHSASDFQAWMSGAFSPQSSFAPSSPDNWLGGTGNWSTVADWSAGEPGSGSDVSIATGNDNVTLDVSASINSLTLGGTTGSSMLANSGSSSLTIAGALTINHTGTLTLSGGAGATAGGTVMNAGTVNLGSGGGFLQGATVINSGTINLTVGFVGATGTLTNSGTINGAGGGPAGVGGGTVINSGTIDALSVGSSGDFTNQAGAVIAQNLNVGGNLINQGMVEGLMRASQMTVTGELMNSGTFNTEYSNATVGSLNNLIGGEISDVSGTMTVNGNASNAGLLLVGAFGAGSPPGSLSIEGNLTNSGSVGVSAVTDGPAGGTVSGSIVNSGSISVTGGGRFGAGGNITNSGMITTGQQNGGMGGSSIGANGTLANQAGGVFALYSMGDTASFGYVNNAGAISIANGATLQIVSTHSPNNALPGFLNSGTVSIVQGGLLTTPLTYSQTGGRTTVDGTLHVSGFGNVNFAGGAVYGNGGTIQGNVISNAMFNMGDMPMTVGMMAITGNYTQGANGSIAFDIASLTQFDQINVSGRAGLNGTAFVDLLNGYVPQIGNTFDIMNFASHSGTFSMVIGLPINNQEHFVLEYNPTNLTLDVVSGPDLQAASGKGAEYYEPYISEVTAGSNQLENYSSAGLTSVPEPGSLVLLCSGIVGIAALRRKKIS